MEGYDIFYLPAGKSGFLGARDKKSNWILQNGFRTGFEYNGGLSFWGLLLTFNIFLFSFWP